MINREFYEDLTVKADQALVNEEEKQKRMKHNENELKELHEKAERHRQEVLI